MKMWKIKSIVLILLLSLSSQVLSQVGVRRKDNRLRLAQYHERVGNYEESLKIYKSLYLENPNNKTYYQGMRRNLLYLKRYQQLAVLIEERLKKKSDLPLQADLGDVYYKMGRQEEALAIWEEIIRDNFKNAGTYQTVARVLIENRLLNGAISVYKRGREQIGNQSLFVFDLANLYIARLNYKDATLEYVRYLMHNPKQFAFIEGRIAGYTKEAEAIQLVAEVIRAQIREGKNELLLRRLLAGLFMRSGDYGSAFAEYKTIDELMAQGQQRSKLELFNFAEMALREGAYPFSQKAYSLILSKYPQSPYLIKAQYGLACSYQKQGFYPEALLRFEELIAAYPNSPQAEEALYQIGEIKFNEFFELEGAIEAFSTIVEKYPRSSKRWEAIFKVGDCLLAKGDLEDAEKWYQIPGGKVQEQALFKLAQLDFMKGNFDEALKKLEQICQRSSVDPRGKGGTLVNDALELTLLIEENRDDSEGTLKEYSKTLILEARRMNEEALEKLRQLMEEHPQAPIADEALLKIGELEFRLGRYNASIEAYQRLIAQYPQSYYVDLAQKRIGEVYEKGLGNLHKAQEAYELVLVNYPRSLLLEEVRKKIRELEAHKQN